MKTRTTLSLATHTLFISTTTLAEVTLDGTLGNRGTLPGPDYLIGADVGQQHGGNLFHSFQDFNLQSHESATFSGPDNVQNVISRVTGGNPSSIDGTLRSTIPNADMYFLNPYGIMFGPNAKLDVQGGFHASTADYLRLSDGGRFEARYPNNSLLTVAPVAAFGFLTDSPAPIQTHSSKLSVLADKTLSLIGGDIHLTSDTPLTADNTLPIPAVTSESILTTPHGRVNLASISNRGEVIPTDHDLLLEGHGGSLTIENTLVDQSGNGGGAAFIRAGRLVIDNAIIRSNTLGTQDGQDFSIKATDAIYLRGVNSEISLVTASEKNTGNLFIETPYLEMTNATINTGTILSNGSTGFIKIQANQLLLKDGAVITSAAAGAGNTGDLIFEVTDRFSLSGYYPGWRFNHGQPSYNFRTIIVTITMGMGRVGDILVNTKHLEIDRGNIAANAIGTAPGGNITIQAQSIRLVHSGQIESNTGSTAPAGYVKIRVAGQLYVGGWRPPLDEMSLGQVWAYQPSSISSGTELFSSGKGAMIDIEANEVVLTEDGFLGANSWENSTGDAGEIYVKANTIRLSEGGNITASAEQAGGGNINLFTPNLLYLRQGEITTSVKGGNSNGGNITINNPVFVILASAKIIAQADEGKGGNITIRANQFIATPPPDSLVSASSKLGIDGQVVIASPNPDISSKLFLVSTKGLDVSSQLKRPCGSAKSLEEIMNPRFKFYVYPIAGSRQSFEDWGPSPLPSRSANASANGKTGASPGRGKPATEKVAQAGYQPVMLVVECPKEAMSTGNIDRWVEVTSTLAVGWGSYNEVQPTIKNFWWDS